MSDNDLIRRGDALAAVHDTDSRELAQHGESRIADRIAALPAVTVDPALSDRAVRVAEALRNIGPMLDLRLSGATIIYELLAQTAALRAELEAYRNSHLHADKLLLQEEARAERLEAALREIAAEASVTVHTWKNGINFKKMYEGWRKIAVERIDIARAALKGADHE